MSHSTPVDALVNVSCKVIITLDSKVLLLKKKGKWWDLPGGKLDEGEELEQTAVREVKEETGLKVTVGDILSCRLQKRDDANHRVFIFYHSKLKEKPAKIRLSDEHVEWGFFSAKDMKDMYLNDIQRIGLKESIKKIEGWKKNGN
ncbi:MAG: NUDIX hydrolase [Rhodospirillales bacterium]|nr:NUDIX hydrolase [Rhodospirillales bacterium]